jgi:hypothetical protein
MKALFINRIGIALFLIFTPLLLSAQDPIRKTKKRTFHSILVEKRTNRAKRKEDKKKWKEERQVKIVTEKNVRQHHKRLQTKKTRKAMRELKKKSKQSR